MFLLCWRKRSATTKVCGVITNKGSKVLVGYCSICYRKKRMTVSNKTIQAESLGETFKNLVNKGLNVPLKLAKNVLRNPSPALDSTAHIATSAAS